VGTTRWTGAAHPGRPLDEATASLYRSGVADVDALFRELVARRRDLTTDAVSALSGGVPWSGVRAIRSGLADSRGGLKEAIAAASRMAEIDGERVLWFEETPTFREDLALRFLSGRADVSAPRRRGGSPR
jgi:protease-4